MKKRRKMRWRSGVLRIALVLILSASIGMIVCGIVVEKSFERTLPDHFFGLTAKGLAPKFYAYAFEDRLNRIGEAYELAEDFYDQRDGIYVSVTEMPAHLKEAFVAIEDKRFYEHRGVDWYRTMGAGANYLLGFSKSFGASTVTQQLIKNLTGNAELTPRRKLQEILYAIDLEKRMDKSEILELYLNVIHFSDHCNGIGAAAEHYFSKTAKELTLAESATLAAIINNPSYYNPIRHPQNNLQRRNLILAQMEEQGMIDRTACDAAMSEPLGLHVKKSQGDGISSWYADMVIEDVIRDLCTEHGMSRGAAAGLVYGGGLKIEVAMDEAVQRKVENYYRTLNLQKNKNGESAQSALIVIDNKTGDVLGVAGAIGQKKGNRVQNFATQTLRSPGSAIKPITVYAAALERGEINWASVWDDIPVRFQYEGQYTWPHNATGSYRGLTTVSHAVRASTNTVAVKILQKTGLQNAFSFAKERFGIKSLCDEPNRSDCGEAALALGQLHYGVTLRELAEAYTPFADEGIHHHSRSYYRVLDPDGRILLSNADEGEVAMSAPNAAVMTKLMQGVVSHGTASAIRLNSRIECAGKTGTTNRDCDRWFVGYTPSLICGVWCGFEYPEPLTGRNACLKIWDDVMTELSVGNYAKKTFDVPTSLVRVSYCRDSGKLPCEACALDPRGNRAEVGWFVRGTEPTETCDCHVICDYDVVHGGVSHGYCPEENLKRIALIRIDRHLSHPVTVLDAQYVYEGDPIESQPNPDASEPYFGPDCKRNYGVSAVPVPFHRSCPIHTERVTPPALRPDWDASPSDAEE